MPTKIKPRQVRNWDMLPVLLSVPIISALTALPPEHINKLCRLGEIPGARKIGRFWFVDKDKLKEYFTGGEEE